MSKTVKQMAEHLWPDNDELSCKHANAYMMGANAVLSEIEKCLESDHSEDCHFTIYQNIIETIKKLKGE